MIHDENITRLCEDIFKLSEGAPEDREVFVTSLMKTIERYDTPAEEEVDFVVTQLVYSMLNLVMRHGTEDERRLADECCE